MKRIAALYGTTDGHHVACSTRPLTHRSIMVLGTFMLLTSDGNHTQADHVFTGGAGDMVAVTDVFDTVHCENHRLCAAPVLANQFHNGATYPIPCVRLTKVECRVLVDAITDFGQSMPKTTRARRLADLLASSVCVY